MQWRLSHWGVGASPHCFLAVREGRNTNGNNYHLCFCLLAPRESRSAWLGVGGPARGQGGAAHPPPCILTAWSAPGPTKQSVPTTVGKPLPPAIEQDGPLSLLLYVCCMQQHTDPGGARSSAPHQSQCCHCSIVTGGGSWEAAFP